MWEYVSVCKSVCMCINTVSTWFIAIGLVHAVGIPCCCFIYIISFSDDACNPKPSNWNPNYACEEYKPWRPPVLVGCAKSGFCFRQCKLGSRKYCWTGRFRTPEKKMVKKPCKTHKDCFINTNNLACVPYYNSPCGL